MNNFDEAEFIKPHQKPTDREFVIETEDERLNFLGNIDESEDEDEGGEAIDILQELDDDDLSDDEDFSDDDDLSEISLEYSSDDEFEEINGEMRALLGRMYEAWVNGAFE